jgi:3-hydroxybutyryl-CoA dehydrogenase
MPIQTVAVIGAGTAGRAFALRCAAAGFDVVLEDVMPEKLRRAQDDYAALAITAGSLRYALTVEDAVHCADIAIDFVPDELESKLEIFSLLDRMAPPRTILCTPTRTLSITDLASCTYRPTLCIGLQADMTHVVKGRFTSAEAVDSRSDVLRDRQRRDGNRGLPGAYAGEEFLAAPRVKALFVGHLRQGPT